MASILNLRLLLTLLTVICSQSVDGTVSVNPNVRGFSYASYFENHMVLQMAPNRASIWGYAPISDVGAVVTVVLSTAMMNPLNFTAVVQPGPDPQQGVWKVTFTPLSITRPCTIVSSLLNYTPIVLGDILFGDVWVCSGQSNMKFTVSQIFNSTQEAAVARKYGDKIRFFSVGQVESSVPLHDLQNIEIHWSVPDEHTVLPFSAVCWLYAKNIVDKRGVPMGLIETSWGGTNIESWSSPDCLHACNLQSTIDDRVPQVDKDSYMSRVSHDISSSLTQSNSVLWNAMVHPLLNMTIYGVIWYQGEANTNYHCNLYNCTFPAMISDWRQKWFTATHGLTDLGFPFGFVQIGPTDGKPVIAGYADVRWHQTADIGYVPNSILQNVFMAVSFDLTDQDVHYRDKETVSERLSLSGLAVAYRQGGIKYQGPWVTMVYIDFVKHVLTLEFDKGKTEISIRNTGGFEVCCQTSVCDVDGTNWLSTPVITSSHVDNQQTALMLNASGCGDMKLASALRYGWRETPFPYLTAAVYSVENSLPLPPFVIFRNRQGRHKHFHTWSHPSQTPLQL